MNQNSEKQQKLIALTRAWVGTPYHHQQSLRGVGCDCLGLVRGVYEAYMNEPTGPLVPYSRDWADVTGQETLIHAARGHLIEKPILEKAPGDVLVFRFRSWMVAKHAGLMVSNNTMVHAMEGVGVTEVHLGKWWQRHIAAVFSFPDLKIS